MSADTAAESRVATSVPSGLGPAPSLSAEAFLSLGCMEGVFEPVVTPAVPVHYGGGFTPEAAESLGSMEGILEPLVQRAVDADRAERQRARLRPGVLAAIGVAAGAYVLHVLPFAPFTIPAETGGIRHPISAAILAIVTGLILRNTLRLPDTIKTGCKKTVKRAIPPAIVCMGAGLNMQHLASVGAWVILVTLCGIGFALSATYWIGRRMGLSSKTAWLLGAGTGICGNSAIVAVAPLIDAKDEDVALSVGAVNLFGLASMLSWPLLGTWLSLSDSAFGLWAGSSIHAVPQVVAAGYAFSPEAGALATLVKLVRVACLAPLVFFTALWYCKTVGSRSGSKNELAFHYARLVPWFVWGFLTLAALNTLGWIPALHFPANATFGMGEPLIVSVRDALTTCGKLLLTLAMAAIGLEVNLRQLATVGGRALAAGLASTAALGLATLLLIRLVL
ncbi:MAG: YeiH family putative sulfate export transporter [Planctomycetota bacterium]|nr:MAG: YeiH family putative sulfate export transporter [Planctomycetota bacterium]